MDRASTYTMSQACQLNVDNSRSWHTHKPKTVLVPTSLNQQPRRLRSISAMKVEEVLFMKGGVGTESYAHNSSLQKRIIEQAKPTVQRALKDMCGSMLPSNTHFAMADLGCSSGPNTLTTLSIILDALESSCREKNLSMPQVKAFLNDLPGTDFNTLFRLLMDSRRKLNKEQKKRNDLSGLCFVSGTPGSFYERLFPDKFLRFAHSSTSLHFLSQIPKDLVDANGDPLNKENICITERSSPRIHKAYYKQFKNDFTMFLRCHSKELVEGGRMVLTFRGSYKSEKPKLSWDIQFLGSAFNILALQGAIEKKRLDMFNMPFYTPTMNEVMTIIEMEGWFGIDRVETILTDWASSSLTGDVDFLARAKFVERKVRAFIQPILASEFGEPIMDDMFAIFNKMVAENLLRDRKLELLSLVISLKKDILKTLDRSI